MVSLSAQPFAELVVMSLPSKSLLSILVLCASPFSGCKKFVTPNNPHGNYDLEVTSVTFAPTTVKTGDKVIFTTKHRNAGADKINERTYEVELEVDGKVVSFDRATSEIAPKGEVTYSMSPGYFHWQPTKPGIYTYKFTVDTKNTIPETNESNNCITGTITVTP